MSLYLHLFNDLLNFFNVKNLLNNNVKLLLNILSEDRITEKHLEFSLKSVFKAFSIDVIGSNKEESPEELENNDIIIKKS